jgi:hypothetical protein
MTLHLRCCLCGWNGRSIDGWYPGVGGICWEHAVQRGLDTVEHRPLTDEELADLREATL